MLACGPLQHKGQWMWALVGHPIAPSSAALTSAARRVGAARRSTWRPLMAATPPPPGTAAAAAAARGGTAETNLAGAALWGRAVEVYDAAQASGASSKTDTRVEVLPDGGIDFVLRMATALRAKPKGVPAGGGGSSGCVAG